MKLDAWTKSTYSMESNCIEVMRTPWDVVILRDTHSPTTIIATPSADFEDFIAGVKAGEFDPE